MQNGSSLNSGMTLKCIIVSQQLCRTKVSAGGAAGVRRKANMPRRGIEGADHLPAPHRRPFLK